MALTTSRVSVWLYFWPDSLVHFILGCLQIHQKKPLMFRISYSTHYIILIMSKIFVLVFRVHNLSFIWIKFDLKSCTRTSHPSCDLKDKSWKIITIQSQHYKEYNRPPFLKIIGYIKLHMKNKFKHICNQTINLPFLSNHTC